MDTNQIPEKTKSVHYWVMDARGRLLSPKEA